MISHKSDLDTAYYRLIDEAVNRHIDQHILQPYINAYTQIQYDLLVNGSPPESLTSENLEKLKNALINLHSAIRKEAQHAK